VTDNELMEQVRDGRVERLAVLFERHHVRLYNFLLRLTGNQSVSEDLVQEVFCRILKYRATYRGTSKFPLWMYQIARNTHIDYLRKRKEELPLDEQWDEAPSRDLSPSESVEQAYDIALVQEALSRLPLKKREILILSRFQNLKYREIAELLDCHIGTVKAHVHRAIKDLRKIYCDLSGEVVT
jgi:RNA polymerase sigma-70 factor (ECF subfamily)